MTEPVNPVSGEPQNEREFYLQVKPEGREFIDDRVHGGCKVLETVTAPCWRMARELVFGP